MKKVGVLLLYPVGQEQDAKHEACGRCGKDGRELSASYQSVSKPYCSTQVEQSCMRYTFSDLFPDTGRVLVKCHDTFQCGEDMCCTR